MTGQWELAINLGVIFVVAAAAVTDLCQGKVYNVLTVPVVVIGLAMNGLAQGWPGLLFSLQGIGLGLTLLLGSVIFGQYMGGGDIKLLMAIGALRGPGFLLYALVFSILLGGVLALVIALVHGALGASCRRLAWALYGRLAWHIPSELVQSEQSIKFPYALAIAGGTLAALWW